MSINKINEVTTDKIYFEGDRFEYFAHSFSLPKGDKMAPPGLENKLTIIVECAMFLTFYMFYPFSTRL